MSAFEILNKGEIHEIIEAKSIVEALEYALVTYLETGIIKYEDFGIHPEMNRAKSHNQEQPMNDTELKPHEARITRRGLRLTIETLEQDEPEETEYQTLNDLLFASIAKSKELRKKGYRITLVHL